MCGTNRGHCKLYSKERHSGGLADRLGWKITAVPVTSWHMGLVGDTRHLPRAKMCSNESVLQRVDYD